MVSENRVVLVPGSFFYRPNSSSRIPAADKALRESLKTGTKDSRDEYGTDAKKKAISATMAEADVQMVLGVPKTDEEGASIAQKRRKAVTTDREGDLGVRK